MRYTVRKAKNKKLNKQEFEHIAPALRRKSVEAARSCGLDIADAEDVAQDVLLKLWSLRDDLTAEQQAMSADRAPGRLLALAYVAARNLSLDRLRRRRTVPIADRPVADNVNTPPDKLLEIADNERWLEQRMARLPSTEYQVLRLRQVERRSNDEIAAILGIGAESVTTLLSRARRHLLEALKKR